MSSKEVSILGLMSGSSLDGLDLAEVKFTIQNNKIKSWKLIGIDFFKYSTKTQETLRNAINLNGRELIQTNYDISRLWAEYINTYIKKNKTNPNYIASHGHTIFHFPENGFTCQIGNGGVLASLTKVDTICDFRSQDIALNGKGTPLAPIVEKYLFPENKIFINLGGIANISFHNDNNIIGYDVCPCNQILNYYSKKIGYDYDKDGILARNGIICKELLEEIDNLSYYKQVPPKSLDNSTLMSTYTSLIDKYNLNVENILTTFTEHISNQISKELIRYPTSQIMLSGGGTNNLFLLDRIRSQGLSLHIPSKKIIDYKESILMSLLGVLRIFNIPNVLSSVTGSKKNTTSGCIYKA